MSDYIKREDVVEKLVRTFLLQAPTARAIVEAIPSANVVERKTGKWARRWEDRNGFSYAYETCSECGYSVDVCGYDFCSNCGAQMESADDV